MATANVNTKGSTSVNTALEKLINVPDGALISGKRLKQVVKEILKALPVAGSGVKIEEGPHGRMIHSTASMVLPKHPWELYENEGGWSVFPATVNLTHQPTLEGVSLFAVPPPVMIPDGSGNLEAWLSFDLDASSTVGIGGLYRLLSGSQVLSNVEVDYADTGTTEVSVDEGTGTVTPGHYSVLIGTIVGGVKASQVLRFSTFFNLCGGGGLSPVPYG
jgi:hypothetical protein